jgi:hypothetical protein
MSENAFKHLIRSGPFDDMVCTKIGTSKRLQGSPAGEEVKLLVDVGKSLRRGTFSEGVRNLT